MKFSLLYRKESKLVILILAIWFSLCMTEMGKVINELDFFDHFDSCKKINYDFFHVLQNLTILLNTLFHPASLRSALITLWKKDIRLLVCDELLYNIYFVILTCKGNYPFFAEKKIMHT